MLFIGKAGSSAISDIQKPKNDAATRASVRAIKFFLVALSGVAGLIM
ncbi:MAG: hypothetical protein AAFN63_01825 [Pseudomonadota bacterium]